MASNKKAAANTRATRRTGATHATRAIRAASGPPAAGPVVLGAALTIAEVAQCARGFAAMFAGGTAQADARALESIDTAGLQLLLAAAAAAQQRGLKLSLRGAPQLLTGAADALGVSGELFAAVELSA